jgi:two-component system CheB/CheR fusion protein
VRDLIVFAQQNVISDPPFTKLDLLSCRNLLIYLSPTFKRRSCPLPLLFKPWRSPVPGVVRDCGQLRGPLHPVDSRWRIFLRRDISLARNVVVEFPRLPQMRETRAFGTWKEHKDLDPVSASAEKVILEKVAPQWCSSTRTETCSTSQGPQASTWSLLWARPT